MFNNNNMSPYISRVNTYFHSSKIFRIAKNCFDLDKDTLMFVLIYHLKVLIFTCISELTITFPTLKYLGGVHVKVRGCLKFEIKRKKKKTRTLTENGFEMRYCQRLFLNYII